MHELAVILDVWSKQSRTDSTAERLSGLITRFATRLIATGVSSLLEATLVDCESFVWARTRRNVAPSIHTVHLRRTALRSLFQTVCELEPGSADPTNDMALPPRGHSVARVFTDHEMVRVRVAALGRVRSSDRAALAVALAESTATTGEIPQVRWHHVDLAMGTVALFGASPIRARTGTLSVWGRDVLARVVRETSPAPEDFVVTRRGNYADPHCAQAAVANLLTKVIRAAGLADAGGRPTSIRLWGATCVLDTRGIEAAAAALGVSSLDTTLRSLRRSKGSA
jgi:integrase/recombinase XerC